MFKDFFKDYCGPHMKIYVFTFIIEGLGGIFLQGVPICDNNDGICQTAVIVCNSG